MLKGLKQQEQNDTSQGKTKNKSPHSINHKARKSESPSCFLPSFKSIGLSVQEKKQKLDFQDGRHGRHLGFPRTVLAIFDLQVTPMLPNKYQINWTFGLGEEAENRFSRWWSWWPSWISDRK